LHPSWPIDKDSWKSWMSMIMSCSKQCMSQFSCSYLLLLQWLCPEATTLKHKFKSAFPNTFCKSLQLNFALLLSVRFHHVVSGYASLPMNMWGNAKSLCGKTVSSGNFKLRVAKLGYRVSENPTIALFTTGSYIHSYKFKICIHNSLQNNGMILLVVKTLAARIWRAFNSNVLSTCTHSAIWEILANRNLCNFFQYVIRSRRHMSCLYRSPYRTGCLLD
jgi:hypothetical protein